MAREEQVKQPLVLKPKTLFSLLLSLESVFAVLAGLVFGDTMGLREWFGCALMFTAVVIAQLPIDKRTKQV
jgi:drug/metabolite transporter (DMT)-like permease